MSIPMFMMLTNLMVLNTGHKNPSIYIHMYIHIYINAMILHENVYKGSLNSLRFSGVFFCDDHYFINDSQHQIQKK